MTIFQVGITESLSGIFTYFVILGQFGFWPELVVGSRDAWSNPAINSFEDSYGQEWVNEGKPVYASFKESLDYKLSQLYPNVFVD